MKTSVVVLALFVLAGPCRAQEDPNRKAYAALSRLKGLSGLLCTTATEVVLEITFARSGQDNDELMRQVMKHRYGLGGLQTLNVRDADLTDAGAREVRELPELEVLQLANNRITDKGLEGMTQLPKLQGLGLGGNPVTGVGLKHKEMPNLRELGLGGCPLSDAGLRVIAGHKNLETLSLSDTALTDEELKHLTSLKALTELDLNNDPVTDAGIKELAALPLRSLHLEGTRVSGAGFRDFTSLRSLALSRSAMTDDGLKDLAGNKELDTLDLRGTRVTDEGMKHVAALPVRRLDLHGTKVTAKGLKALAAIKSLSKLTLSNDQMTDEALRTLFEGDMLHKYYRAQGDPPGRPAGNTREITRLFLVDTPVTDASLKTIAALNSLRLVNLRGTNVTDEGVEGLKKERPQLKIMR
jgi:internalin A